MDAEPAAPLTKKGAGAAATWTPSFLLLPALSRAKPEFFMIKGRQSPKTAILPNRPERGRNEERARQSYHRGRKSVFPSDKTHPRPSSAFFFFFDEKEIQSRSPKAFSFLVEPFL